MEYANLHARIRAINKVWYKNHKIWYFFVRCVHDRIRTRFEVLYPMLEVRMGYSWDIRGVFTEYSWSIRMYRVCIGYVSGMYRECIERNRVRVGSSNFMQDNLHNEYIINNLNNIYFSTTCAPINFLGRFKEISWNSLLRGPYAQARDI